MLYWDNGIGDRKGIKGDFTLIVALVDRIERGLVAPREKEGDLINSSAPRVTGLACWAVGWIPRGVLIRSKRRRAAMNE